MLMMRVLLVTCGFSPLAWLLHGCGGGGGGGGPTTTPGPTPSPGPPTPGPTTAPFVPKYGPTIKAVSYNLFWWCVSGNPQGVPERHGERCSRYKNGEGFKELFKKINDQAPFDVIGFQEIVDLNKVVSGLGLADTFDSFFAPPQFGGVHDSGMAWSKAKFTKQGEAAAQLVCTDQYGPRYASCVRLKVTGTDSVVLFCNTHGPLTHCDAARGKALAGNYMAAIEKMRQPGDNLVFTGDFNCLPVQESMQLIMKNFTTVHDKTMTYDNIVRSNWVRMDKHYAAWAPPSDHSILTATLSLPDWGGKPAHADPPPSPSPGYTTPAPPGPPAPKSKCADLKCGNHDGTCYCTPGCEEQKDCCPDYEDTCGKPLEDASFKV